MQQTKFARTTANTFVFWGWHRDVRGVLVEGQAKGTVRHMSSLRELQRYILKTRKWRIKWTGGKSVTSNSTVLLELDFDANLPQSGKSRSGCSIFVSGLSTAGHSSKQTGLATNTYESEIMSGSWSTKLLVGLKHVLEELTSVLKFKLECIIYGDNQATNLFANSQCSMKRAKHLRLNDLYIRVAAAEEGIKVIYKETALNSANQMTKVLGGVQAEAEAALLMIGDK